MSRRVWVPVTAVTLTLFAVGLWAVRALQAIVDAAVDAFNGRVR